MKMAMTDSQREALDGWKELVAHLEANPELIDIIGYHKIYAFFHKKDGPEFARRAMLLAPFTKSTDESYFNVERDFGPNLTIQLTARHELICEKVVVGTEEVEVVERDEALVSEALAAIPTTKVTKTIEHTEWKCPASLVELAKS